MYDDNLKSTIPENNGPLWQYYNNINKWKPYFDSNTEITLSDNDIKYFSAKFHFSENNKMILQTNVNNGISTNYEIPLEFNFSDHDTIQIGYYLYRQSVDHIFNIKQMTSYTLSFSLHGRPYGNGNTIRISYTEMHTGTIYIVDEVTPSNSSWTNYSYEVPINVNNATITLSFQNIHDGDRSIGISNIKLQDNFFGFIKNGNFDDTTFNAGYAYYPNDTENPYSDWYGEYVKVHRIDGIANWGFSDINNNIVVLQSANQFLHQTINFDPISGKDVQCLDQTTLNSVQMTNPITFNNLPYYAETLIGVNTGRYTLSGITSAFPIGFASANDGNFSVSGSIFGYKVINNSRIIFYTGTIEINVLPFDYYVSYYSYYETDEGGINKIFYDESCPTHSVGVKFPTDRR